VCLIGTAHKSRNAGGVNRRKAPRTRSTLQHTTAKETDMRKTIHDGEIRAGLAAAAKATAVVLAVGMLAVVAGKAGYTSDAAIAASPAHALAAAPVNTAAPDAAFPMPPASLAGPAPAEPPVASF
jgi:hypothetical protein